MGDGIRRPLEPLSTERGNTIHDVAPPSHFICFQGLFQGRLVARTFLEHVQIVHTINPDHRLQKRPVGALILAIQAVSDLSFVLCAGLHNCILGTPCAVVFRLRQVRDTLGQERCRVLKDKLGRL
jgi:hypothetical protein